MLVGVVAALNKAEAGLLLMLGILLIVAWLTLLTESGKRALRKGKNQALWRRVFVITVLGTLGGLVLWCVV